jgi:putative GTP pyrophosphokinase
MNSTKIIIREFYSNIDLFRDYSTAVINLLENLLKKSKFKYQITNRIKTPESLKEKIIRKKRVGKIYKHINDIEDIVGIRIIFYTENDRKKFIKYLNHAIGNGTLRMEETSKVSGYRSTHAVITFGTDRTHLDEYRMFKGLKCEIQMTLILDNAWAEVEHDIFYKEGSCLHGLNKEKYTALKRRMEMVMHDYIRKASSGLENIVRNVKRLETQK